MADKPHIILPGDDAYEFIDESKDPSADTTIVQQDLNVFFYGGDHRCCAVPVSKDF